MKKILLILFVCLSAKMFACHGLALVGVNVTSNANSITLNGSSDPASCGCGPYWLQVELSYTGSFTATPPPSFGPGWGVFPWYHSLLDIPGYGPPSWTDQCAFEPYVPITIQFSALCPGATVYWRYREWVEYGTPSPWFVLPSFTVPGSPATLTGVAFTSDSLICAGDSTFLNVLHNGCSGNYSAYWLPTTGLSNPNDIATTATPTVTTTYTVSFTDIGLGQTISSAITIYVGAAAPSASIVSTAPACVTTHGRATASVTGGNPPMSYYWSSGETTIAADSLWSGYNYLQVQDAYGCIDTLSVYLADSCDYVWPGDADDNGMVLMNDFLNIGLANGFTGPTRTAPTINYIGQWCVPWSTFYSSGINHKFADCNGDGIVDPTDTIAVAQNYGQFHPPRYGNQATAVDPVLYADFIPDTLGNSSAGILRMSLGDNSVPADSVYGICFTVNYEEAFVDPLSIGINATASWIASANNRMHMRVVTIGNGQADVAITRLNHSDTSGAGILFDIYFMTTDSLQGSGSSVNSPVSITNVQFNSSTGNIHAVNVMNDTLVITDGFALNVNNRSNEQSGPYPNPTDGSIVVPLPHGRAEQIRVVDVTGRDVFTAANYIIGAQYEFDMSSLKAGVYFVLVSEQGTQHQYRIVRQ